MSQAENSGLSPGKDAESRVSTLDSRRRAPTIGFGPILSFHGSKIGKM